MWQKHKGKFNQKIEMNHWLSKQHNECVHIDMHTHAHKNAWLICTVCHMLTVSPHCHYADEGSRRRVPSSQPCQQCHCSLGTCSLRKLPISLIGPMSTLTWWTTSLQDSFGWPPRWLLYQSWLHPSLDWCMTGLLHISPLYIKRVKDRVIVIDVGFTQKCNPLIQFISFGEPEEEKSSVTHIEWSIFIPKQPTP